jgi:hypothetical protein
MNKIEMNDPIDLYAYKPLTAEKASLLATEEGVKKLIESKIVHYKSIEEPKSLGSSLHYVGLFISEIGLILREENKSFKMHCCYKVSTRNSNKNLKEYFRNLPRKAPKINAERDNGKYFDNLFRSIEEEKDYVENIENVDTSDYFFMISEEF